MERHTTWLGRNERDIGVPDIENTDEGQKGGYEGHEHDVALTVMKLNGRDTSS